MEQPIDGRVGLSRQRRGDGRVSSKMAVRYSRVGLCAVMLSGAVVLGACGFEPMMAVRQDKTTVSDELSRIRIAYIDNRAGQILRNSLIDSLTPRGEPSQAKYTLVIKIVEPRQSLAYQRNDSVVDVGYTVSASFWLYDSKSTMIWSASSSSSSTYAVSTSQYATVASLENTRDRVMQDLSSDIRNQLATYFATPRHGQ